MKKGLIFFLLWLTTYLSVPSSINCSDTSKLNLKQLSIGAQQQFTNETGNSTGTTFINSARSPKRKADSLEKRLSVDSSNHSSSLQPSTHGANTTLAHSTSTESSPDSSHTSTPTPSPKLGPQFTNDPLEELQYQPVKERTHALIHFQHTLDATFYKAAFQILDTNRNRRLSDDARATQWMAITTEFCKIFDQACEKYPNAISFENEETKKQTVSILAQKYADKALAKYRNSSDLHQNRDNAQNGCCVVS